MPSIALPHVEGHIQEHVEVKASALFATTHYELWTFLTNLGMSAIVIFAFGFPIPTKAAIFVATAAVVGILSY